MRRALGIGILVLVFVALIGLFTWGYAAPSSVSAWQAFGMAMGTLGASVAFAGVIALAAWLITGGRDD